MPIASLTKEFKFEAAHQLYNHKGKCRNLHGHSYKVILHVSGPIIETPGVSDQGMVMDYADMKTWWKRIEPELDHRNLNETLDHIGPTTAENISRYIFDTARVFLGDKVKAVTVKETDSSSATYRIGEKNG